MRSSCPTRQPSPKKLPGRNFRATNRPNFTSSGSQDDAHPAADQLCDDAVVLDGLADHGRRAKGAIGMQC